MVIYRVHNQAVLLLLYSKSEYTKTILKVGPELFISMKREDIYSIYSVGKLLGEGNFVY